VVRGRGPAPPSPKLPIRLSFPDAKPAVLVTYMVEEGRRATGRASSERYVWWLSTLVEALVLSQWVYHLWGLCSTCGCVCVCVLYNFIIIQTDSRARPGLQRAPQMARRAVCADVAHACRRAHRHLAGHVATACEPRGRHRGGSHGRPVAVDSAAGPPPDGARSDAGVGATPVFSSLLFERLLPPLQRTHAHGCLHTRCQACLGAMVLPRAGRKATAPSAYFVDWLVG
jgi:hypothetical protein